MKKIIKGVLLLSLFCILFSSCIKEVPFATKELKRVELIYCAGDESEINQYLQQIPILIKDSWQYTGNRTLIYFDSVNDVPKLYAIRGGCPSVPEPFIELVDTYNEGDSASSEIFAKVINRVYELYPAESYGLIFTSHGTGWLPANNYPDSNKTIGLDNNTGDLNNPNSEMEISDLAKAIKDNQFDYIILEACLMSGIEVAYELRDKTKYILASSAELIAPGFNPIYAKAHHYLMNTDIELEEALKLFANDYYAFVNSYADPVYRSTTLSITKTKELESLALMVKDIYPTAENSVIDMDAIQHFDRTSSEIPSRFFDFGHYTKQLVSADKYTQIQSLLTKIIVWKAATPTFFDNLLKYNGFKIDHHSGLTVYAPQLKYPLLNESYKQMAWYKATRTDG